MKNHGHKAVQGEYITNIKIVHIAVHPAVDFNEIVGLV